MSLRQGLPLWVNHLKLILCGPISRAHAIRLLSFRLHSRFYEPVFDSSLIRFHPNGIALYAMVFKPRDFPLVIA